MIYFTSDQHFGHKRIIELCNRPFSCVSEMDNTMVSNWNSTVRGDDTVYVLGDFAFKNGPAILNQLSGRKILIQGNHDKSPKLSDGWYQILPYYEITVDETFVVLCHYPILEWNHYFRNSIHLYGHCHNRKNHPEKNAYDVGVDGNNFTPITLEQVKEKIGYGS